MIRAERRFDAVVIGAGTAGMTAAIRLAQEGARVCVLAKGLGSIPLAPGTIDVLGYDPEPVAAPGPALQALVRELPEHPYARIGPEAVSAALAWLAPLIASGPLPGYRYLGDLRRNSRLPSALGALRPCALVPETMAGGEAAQLQRVCIVGFGQLRDFHAQLCAANLRLAGIQARALTLALELERADANAQGIARCFDQPSWRARLCAELAPRLEGDERVGLPAVLGLSDPHGALVDLERRLGRPVFEIPGLPPSPPGLRLWEILRSALRDAGGRLALGAEVLGGECAGERLLCVSTASAGHPSRYLADTFVLASGGFSSGAIELDSHWRARERVLGLELAGLPSAQGPRFLADYWAEQPLARVGVQVDEELRAAGYENVYVAGAALPGAVPWRELSGEGIALASGFRVAQLICAGRAMDEAPGDGAAVIR
jgi:glycerol-3-phosphate dehydrogenase subunit B